MALKREKNRFIIPFCTIGLASRVLLSKRCKFHVSSSYSSSMSQAKILQSSSHRIVLNVAEHLTSTTSKSEYELRSVRSK